ncbi:hypothetical protein [Kitasatospora sp. NPDC059599]|uniref:hypothetical protein n=1 Tax=Kitasatospora sp. NPDC059599 TaxID=3346880 RepID=UPI00369327C7
MEYRSTCWPPSVTARIGRPSRPVFEFGAQRFQCLGGAELLGALGGAVGDHGDHRTVRLLVLVGHSAPCRASRSATA